MGNSSTSLNVETKIWPKSFSHENYTNNFDRNLALVSYETNEYLSLGKIDTDVFKQQFGDEFFLKNTGGFFDAYRKSYSNDPKCCLIQETYFIDDKYKINSCSPSVHTFNSDLCDDVLYKTCIVEANVKHFKCKPWIRSVVERQTKYFKNIKEYAQKEENRNSEITQVFMVALYDFNNDTNNYLDIIDSIINSYSEKIKKNEYNCAFPSDNILNEEKKINTPKECWYKDCVLAPVYKLKSENLYKRKQCTLTICDINIKNLNIGNNKIEIICQNKFDQQINLKNIAIKADKDTYFYIPTFYNNILPLLFILSFLFIKIK